MRCCTPQPLRWIPWRMALLRAEGSESDDADGPCLLSSDVCFFFPGLFGLGPCLITIRFALSVFLSFLLFFFCSFFGASCFRLVCFLALHGSRFLSSERLTRCAGNFYSITNDNEVPARIFFAQGCEVAPEPEQATPSS